MNENDISLFSEFPPVSTETWEAQINADLKGKDYERTLVWQTREGLKVRPYYREEDLKGLDFTNNLPGQFPYVRGKRAGGNDWLVRQEILVTGLEKANATALNIVTKGVTSLGFVFKENRDISVDDLKTLFTGINFGKVEVNLSMPGKKRILIDSFIAFLKEQSGGISVKTSVNYDPIGAFTLKGKFCTTEAEAFTRLKELVESVSEIKGLQLINVNGMYFNNAGSSIVQELGYSLAIGAEYLTQLTGLGLDAGVIAPKMRFNFGVGGNYFMEIAKLRAARLLWAKIVKAYNPICTDCKEEKDEEVCLCAGKMTIHSETSVWNKTIYDPYVNMLRTQTESMSAALGGTDSLTVLPFDIVYEQPTEFAERIARNQQALLKEEANFDKITDPAAGSYYIESLTASVAEQSWNIFLDIQEKGGFISAFRQGIIQNQLKDMAVKRMKAIASRRDNILGVNQFANVTEQITTEIPSSLFEVQDMTSTEAEVETIKMFRGASEIEALRYATDNYTNLNPRPKVFMLTIGDLTMRKARAQFSGNFFAVAGYDIIDNNGFDTVVDGVNAALEANADIVVMCSSDDEYAAYAPEAFHQLNNSAIFVVAGAPASADELKAAGIENFINVKTNLLESLSDFNNKLGIKKAI